MADTSTPPAFDLTKGIYFPQLTEEFKISRDAAYDYYSTNSGMYPKNPGGGGGGGGGGGDLSSRVADLEAKQDKQSKAAKESINMLSDGYVLSQDIEEIEQIITNQNILRDSQENLYKAI